MKIYLQVEVLKIFLYKKKPYILKISPIYLIKKIFIFNFIAQISVFLYN